MTNLSTLKSLAVCLGCCESTKDNPATNNAEAIEFICEHIGSVASSGVSSITLNLAKNKSVESGTWTDTAGRIHDIQINR